ncbi:hypothetical protein [Dokdonella sp.]|uniref:hypothetical protein n=1 Tax=Dokdonella sp. TaxID=2291710 RepID=UPI0031BD3484|nr:hypothetical protein [Dokdonella sp.]
MGTAFFAATLVGAAFFAATFVGAAAFFTTAAFFVVACFATACFATAFFAAGPVLVAGDSLLALPALGGRALVLDVAKRR